MFWSFSIASLAWAVLSIRMSMRYLARAAREGDASAGLRGLGDVTYLGGLEVGEAALILVAISLAAALLWFVLFVIWLPLVVIVLAAVTFGEAWRIYRCVWIVAEDTTGLREIGKGLLDLGAVVSRSWDVYLDEADLGRALDSRKAQYRANRMLAAVGISGLGLVVAFLSGRFLPEIVGPLVIATAALTGISSILFADAVRRLRRRRSHD